MELPAVDRARLDVESDMMKERRDYSPIGPGLGITNYSSSHSTPSAGSKPPGRVKGR